MSRNLLHSTALVATMTLFSRLLGFVRDMVIAHYFGATGAVDAFLVAFKVPNFMRRLFAEGAFSQAFVPVLTEYRQSATPTAAMQLINNTAGSLGLLLVLFTLVAELAAPLLTALFAPGYVGSPSHFELTTEMLHITLPYVLLIGLTAFAGAILNAYRYFVIPALTPAWLNVSLIVAAVWLAPQMDAPIMALAWAVLLAGVVQLLFQLPFLWHWRLLPRPQCRFGDKGVKRILKLMPPALLGVSVVQISVLFDTVFASFLPSGSIAWLYYADRITSLPLGIVAVAVATVVLPHLSWQQRQAQQHDYSQTVDWGIRLVLLIGLPAAIALLLLAQPLLTGLLQYGEFSAEDVRMTSQCMMAYALGVPAFMLVKILASAFYAHQETRLPVCFAVIALSLNFILNALLIFPLAHAGLALATSLSSMVNAGLLYWGLCRRSVYQPSRQWGRFLGQLLFANAVLASALVWGSHSLAPELDAAWQTRMMSLMIIVGGGVMIYFVALYLVGMRQHNWRGQICN